MSGLNNPELIQELKEVEDQFNEGLEEIAGTPNQLHYEQLYNSLFMSREHAKKDVYARHGKNYKMKRIYGSDNHWFVPENYPRNNERNGINAFENRPLNNANHPQNPIYSQVSVNNYNNNPNIVNTSNIHIRTSSKRGRNNENNDPNNANNVNNANTIINEGYETNDPITQTRKKLKTRRGGKRKRNHRSIKTKRYAKKTQRR